MRAPFTVPSRVRTGLDRHGRTLILGAAMLGVICLGGCLRGEPLDWRVQAKDSRGFASWRTKVDGSLGAENRRRLDEAVQEVRVGVSAERHVKRFLGEELAANMSDVDAAVFHRIHDRPVREVIQLGYEMRERRLQEELAAMENAVKTNSQLVTKPGDLDSRHYLEGLQQRQAARLEKYRADLAAAERELKPLLAASGKRLLTPATGDAMGAVSKQTK